MQTVQSDDWRPGLAKRADNFPAVCAAAEAWRWSPGESVARVAAGVLKGTPSLSTPQRMTLLLYVEHLNQDRLEQDLACVWPSTALVAQYLGCSESQARANRKALEAAGFMVRDYTRANRPAGVEAYDLRPLMARLGELEGIDEAIREALAARRAAYSETIAFPTKYSARDMIRMVGPLRGPRTARPTGPRPNAEITAPTAPLALQGEPAGSAARNRTPRCTRKWSVPSCRRPCGFVPGSRRWSGTLSSPTPRTPRLRTPPGSRRPRPSCCRSPSATTIGR